MSSQNLQSAHKVFGWSTVTLGLLSVAIISASVMQSGAGLEGWVVKKQVEYPWISLSAVEVMSGATIPPNANVVFHLPGGFEKIGRETLLGLKGKKTRYWGYCFPQNYDPQNVEMRSGFKGLLFLSEKERAVRAAEAAARKPVFSLNNLPSTDEIQTMGQSTKPAIRHQLEVFKPDTLCYIMTEAPLAIGLDFDGDRLNSKMEEEVGTNPNAPDSDGDCIIDGIEYESHTMPDIRDTDADALIDGIEDSNCNGHVEAGETNPREFDSDKDGLCDGVCRYKLQRKYLFIGEDKNLNGDVDPGELDPTKRDTNGDGILDEVEMIQCIAAGEEDCP